MTAERYVATEALRQAMCGREADVLRALGVEWNKGAHHISCPYPDHSDENPSWRWDAHKARAFCTCITQRGGHAILEVVIPLLLSPYNRVLAAECWPREARQRPMLLSEQRRENQDSPRPPPGLHGAARAHLCLPLGRAGVVTGQLATNGRVGVPGRGVAVAEAALDVAQAHP